MRMKGFQSSGLLRAGDFVRAAAIVFFVYVSAIAISIFADRFDLMDRMFSAPVYIATYLVALVLIGAWRHFRPAN